MSDAPRTPSPDIIVAPPAAPPPAAPPRAAPRRPLNATSSVILGMIAFGQRTGYDIKQLVDKTTRHFSAASYGQIYPELRRLEAEGLVRGTPEPSGGRARTVLEMTDAGEAALREWLCDSDEPTYELRDEGMLKLFFSDVVGPEQGLEHVRAIRLRHMRKLEQLRALEEHVGETGRSGLCLTLQLGINLQESTIAWCESTERRLLDEAEEPGGGQS